MNTMIRDRHRAVLGYTARALPLATIAVVLIAAALPTIWTVARGRSSFGLALVAASFVGVVTAFAVDDPAGEFTAVSVVPLWRRRAIRLVVIGVPATAMWAALLTAMSLAQRDAVSTWTVPSREAVTVGAIALGLAGLAHRTDPRAAAPTGAFGAMLVVALISALAFRWRWLPSLGIVDHHERWWYAAAIGAFAALITSRDGAARAHSARRRDRTSGRSSCVTRNGAANVCVYMNDRRAGD